MELIRCSLRFDDRVSPIMKRYDKFVTFVNANNDSLNGIAIVTYEISLESTFIHFLSTLLIF